MRRPLEAAAFDVDFRLPDARQFDQHWLRASYSLLYLAPEATRAGACVTAHQLLQYWQQAAKTSTADSGKVPVPKFQSLVCALGPSHTLEVGLSNYRPVGGSECEGNISMLMLMFCLLCERLSAAVNDPLLAGTCVSMMPGPGES